MDSLWTKNKLIEDKKQRPRSKLKWAMSKKKNNKNQEQKFKAPEARIKKQLIN